MNIKLYTPKILKTDTGKHYMKQFLLSLIATTVSIALTFGTAAVIDHNKKQGEKREIVMMVMYDMYNSLQSIEKADSVLRESMHLQLEIAGDTTKFNTLRYQLTHLIPRIDYTETTENIVSSNIETINTIGNVLFVENVAEFYQNRKMYKTEVCDSITQRYSIETPIHNLKKTLGFEYHFETMLSGYILLNMKNLFSQCKQMMDVTDKEIEVYKKERILMEKKMGDNTVSKESIGKEIMQLQMKIEEAKKKQKIE